MDNDDDNADNSDRSFESVKEELILESSIDSDAEHVQLDRSDERLALMKMKVNLFSTNLICAILMRLQ